MISHSKVQAIAGTGLEGDRYATGQGHYSGVKIWDAHVTLIESEAFAGLKISPEEMRRNLLTQDIELVSLIGKQFRIGRTAIFKGRKSWPPCFHIAQQLNRKQVMKHFSDKGGIGADVIEGGVIHTGDPIAIIGE